MDKFDKINLKRGFSMADITKCSNGINCVHNKDCYRWLAEPDKYSQSWSYFYKEGQECKMLWSITKWSGAYGK